MTEPQTTRLNKHLAMQLGVSRREADELIADRKVTINGSTATLGARFTPIDMIEVDGTKLQANRSHEYIIFHKPVGYVCSRKKQGDSETIYALLPDTLHQLKPVGRLDKDSSGLILLTNDGDFAYQMTHPKFYKTKRYEISLDRDLEPLHQQMINDFGVQLEDGPSKLTLERQSDESRKEWLITMTEGRNRQIRRTFLSLGYTVVALHRTHFGNYSLGDIPAGKYDTVSIH